MFDYRAGIRLCQCGQGLAVPLAGERLWDTCRHNSIPHA
jgi:hypothetical protein